jgi:two-component system sensor histidine kinase TctE
MLAVAADGRVHLSTVDVRGEEVRLVATRVALPGSNAIATVEVGETLHKRGALTTDILLAMAAPQLGLLLVAPLFAWFGVTQGLKPLVALGAAIEARGKDNLTPVPDRPWPREARVLVIKINDLLERLQSAMAAQRRFLADAAHQLRTPIAAVLLFVERAERAPDAESARQALQGLRTSASRAARLVHQLMGLARAEPDAAPMRTLDAVDLVGLARGVGEEWIPRALERKIDFGFVAPDEPVVIAGNAGLLGELMSNLIDNALRYCGPNSRVTVSVEGSPAPALYVEDDGPGIPEAEREKIFERFYRVADNRADGCGLGLSIVREIATLHRAVTRVTRGRDGRGARFTVQFPPLVERSA